jgi:hypothetical protein
LLLRLRLVTSISVCVILATPVVMSTVIGALRAQLRKQARFSVYTEDRRCINAVTPQLLLIFQGRSVHTRLPTVTPSTVVVVQACTLLAPIIILDKCLMVDRPRPGSLVTAFPFQSLIAERAYNHIDATSFQPLADGKLCLLW